MYVSYVICVHDNHMVMIIKTGPVCVCLAKHGVYVKQRYRILLILVGSRLMCLRFRFCALLLSIVDDPELLAWQSQSPSYLQLD